MCFLQNALDSLLVEAAFTFPHDDSTFLIQLSALKVSVMYKQKQALDKEQQFRWKAFYFIAILLMKKAVHCGMPVYSSSIMISFAMNYLEVLVHHLPITKQCFFKSDFSNRNDLSKLSSDLSSSASTIV